MREEHYCNGCFKFDMKKKTCLAFTEVFPMWEDTKEGDECWGREEDPQRWLQSLEEIEEYYNAFDEGRHLTATQKRWMEYAIPEKVRMHKLIEIQINKEIAEVYAKEQKRGKGGGGEKNKDGSMFGPQTQKDNRLMHRKLQPKKYNGWH